MRTQKQHKQMKNDYKLDPMDARAVAWFLNQEHCQLLDFGDYYSAIVAMLHPQGTVKKHGGTPLDAIVALYEQEVLEPARRQMDKEGEA